jgi:hypothetical protein
MGRRATRRSTRSRRAQATRVTEASPRCRYRVWLLHKAVYENLGRTRCDGRWGRSQRRGRAEGAAGD